MPLCDCFFLLLLFFRYLLLLFLLFLLLLRLLPPLLLNLLMPLFIVILPEKRDFAQNRGVGMQPVQV